MLLRGLEAAVRRLTVAALLASAGLLGLAGPSAAAALEGRVARITATEVEIEIAGELLPQVGDEVEIFRVLEGIGPSRYTASWHVTMVALDGVVAQIDGETDVRPMIGALVRVESVNPRPRDQVTARLRGAGGGWGDSFARVRTTVSGTTVGQATAPAPASAVTPLIEGAFQAYTRCDYTAALAHLSTAEAQRAGDSRTAIMRSLVDRQMKAESLFQAASTGAGDLALARQAYAAASPPSVSPPCQMRKIRDLLTSLENVEIAALGEAQRRGVEESRAKWDRIYDTYASELIGLLGQVNSRSSGRPAPPLPSLDSLGTSQFTASTNANCIVQPQGDASGQTFLVEVPSSGGNEMFYLWTMDAAKAQNGGASCESAQDCLLKLLPDAGMRILGSYASQTQARQAAEARCSR